MNRAKSIFLVEDDEDDQIFFAECIDRIENAVMYGIASNGREALHTLDACHTLPDMIFMDINMPLVTGLECLTEIIKNPRLNKIPVIMLSTDTGYSEIARQLGAKAFIKKPTDCTTLQKKVAQLINLDFVSNASFAIRTFQTALYP